MTDNWRHVCLCFQDASLSYDPETPPGEIQSDVVFREGQTLGGHVTYTPRLIAMDLKGDMLSYDTFLFMYFPCCCDSLLLLLAACFYCI